MTKSVSLGPNPTAVGGVASVGFAPAPINFSTDMKKIETGPGKVIYTDVTAPSDRRYTLRIAQQSRPNIYAGTTIDPSVFLSSKRGTDTVVEIKGILEVTDSVDTTFLQQAPYRLALTMTLPESQFISATEMKAMLDRLVAALATQGDDEILAGLTNLAHGVVEKA